MVDARLSSTLFFKRLDPRAELPKQRSGDAGLDIKCLDDTIIKPGETVKLRTGLALAKNPESHLGPAVFLKIEDRSSMALKGIFTHGGIIDPSYRGEFHVILHNSTDRDYWAREGDKIAQAILYPAIFNHLDSQLTCVECDDLQPSERGAGGFGSTGS